MNLEKERERFEAWFADTFKGQYQPGFKQDMCVAYLAAKSEAQADVRELVEVLGGCLDAYRSTKALPQTVAQAEEQLARIKLANIRACAVLEKHKETHGG